MKIQKGSLVRIEFEIRVKGGDVIESSSASGPVLYHHGEGRLLPALEKRLDGLAVGQTLEGEIPAEEVSPSEDALPTRHIPRADYPRDAPLEVGKLFEAHTHEGGTVKLRVVSFDDEKVTMRLVPPLAGKDLSFRVQVMMIEDPVSHARESAHKPAPPLPAGAVKIELEPIDE